jgi:hypothetical protein
VQTKALAEEEEVLKVLFTPSSGRGKAELQAPPVCAINHRGCNSRIKNWYFVSFIGFDIGPGDKIIAKGKQSQPTIVRWGEKGQFPGCRPYFFRVGK